MTRARRILFVWLAASACGSTSPAPETTTSGGESQREQSAAPDGEPGDASVGAASAGDASGTAPSTTPEEAVPAPVDLSAFSPSVHARLENLPALPVSPNAPVIGITLFDASLICGFLDQHVRHEGTVAASCPDGSPVVLGGECNPASVLALRHTFGDACALRFGDYLACEIAARESPCAVGYMRADLPECEAVNACLATQI